MISLGFFQRAIRNARRVADSLLPVGSYGRERQHTANVEQLEPRLMLNSTPVLDPLSDIEANEGDLITVDVTFYDDDPLDTHNATINWGDNTPVDSFDLNASEFAFSGTHTYSDDAVYTVTVTVEDEVPASDTETFQATIDNLAPTIVATGASNVNEGFAYTLFVSADDPGDDDEPDITWTIDWGDGQPPTTATGANPGAQPYTYADGPAAYQISITANDGDGGQTTKFLSLDLSFGYDGKVITDLGGLDEAHAVVIQPDGKILVAGVTTVDYPREAALVRYNLDGSPDHTFGSEGIVVDSTVGYAEILDMTLQSDGRIVVAGNAGNQFVVARYNTDGTLDDGGPDDSTPGDSFGTDGTSHVDFGFRGQDLPLGMKVDSNDGIWVAGDISGAQGWDFCLLHFDSQGQLDTNFNYPDGYVSTDLGGDDVAHDVVVQPDGKILVVGEATTTQWEAFGLVRYQSDGTLDDTFDTDGKVLTEFGTATSVALQDDGKIVVAGSAGGDLALARYTSNGALDVGFGGGDGKVTVDFGGTDSFWSVSIQEDGKIVVGGHTTGSSTREFALARFGPDGTLDPTFGDGGKLTVDFYGNEDFSYDIAIQPDGRIVAVGRSIWDFAITRVGFLAVHDVAPTLDIDAPDTVVDWGEDFAFSVSARDPGDETITGWTIDWGVGEEPTLIGPTNYDELVPVDPHHYAAATSPTNYTVAITVHTDEGDFQAAPFEVAVTAFDWRFDERGGSAVPGATQLDLISGNLRLTEGDSFVSALMRPIVIDNPTGNYELVSYDSFSLDESDTSEWINDAFEIALLGTDGRSLVPTIGPGRDALFNATESLSGLLLAEGVTHTSGTVDTISVDVSHLEAGTQALLVLRLINNDADTGSWVDIPFIQASVGFGASPINEGDQYTLSLSASSPYASDMNGWEIDWADGVVDSAIPITETTASHYFADDGNNTNGSGSYPIGTYLTVGSENHRIAVGNIDLAVNNVAPTLYLGYGFHNIVEVSEDVYETTLVVSGRFDDPGFNRDEVPDPFKTYETFTVMVDWDGDGPNAPEAVPGVIVHQGTDGQLTWGEFSATHTYTVGQTYSITVTVEDDDNGTGSSGIDIKTIGYGVCLVNIRQTVNVGSNGNLTVDIDWPDLSEIDVSSLRFGPAGAAERDGDLTGGAKFKTQQTGIVPEDQVAFLTGSLTDGTPLIGIDPDFRKSGNYAQAAGMTVAETKLFVVEAGIYDPADFGYHAVIGYEDLTNYSQGDQIETGNFIYSALVGDVQSSYPTGIASDSVGGFLWTLDGPSGFVRRWKRPEEYGPTDVLPYEPDGSWLAVNPDGEDPTNLEEHLWEGLTTDGTDIWMVDAHNDSVVWFDQAATLQAGIVLGVKAFPLDTANTNPTGIATDDGSLFWVTDDEADEVFVYNAAGTLVGQWELDTSNAEPSGITVNPLEDDTGDIWTVDRGPDEYTEGNIYRYIGGRDWEFVSGPQTAVEIPLANGNIRPEGIADPPTIYVTEPSNWQHAAESTTTIGGNVEEDGSSVTAVEINGVPAESFDGTNFSMPVGVNFGWNQFVIEAFDATSSATESLALYGMGRPLTESIDLSPLSDVTNAFATTYGRTSFDERTAVLHAGLNLSNVGAVGLRSRLLVGVKNVSNPNVRLYEPDFIGPDGTAYYDVSHLAFADWADTLDVGEALPEFALKFFNPQRVQFDYDLVVLGRQNYAPSFTNDPEKVAYVGGSYEYQATANDLDDDEVIFELLQGPEEMTSTPQGLIEWMNIASGDEKDHFVSLKVSDGFGGWDVKRFTLDVKANEPNGPPYFDSDPIRTAVYGEQYLYSAIGKDDNGDDLTFSVDFDNGSPIPEGSFSIQDDPINPNVGVVTFEPDIDDIGKTFLVTLTVQETSTTEEYRATQSYDITVVTEKGNINPEITSTPDETHVVAGQLDDATDNLVSPSEGRIDLELSQDEVWTSQVTFTIPSSGTTEFTPPTGPDNALTVYTADPNGPPPTEPAHFYDKNDLVAALLGTGGAGIVIQNWEADVQLWRHIDEDGGVWHSSTGIFVNNNSGIYDLEAPYGIVLSTGDAAHYGSGADSGDRTYEFEPILSEAYDWGQGTPPPDPHDFLLDPVTGIDPYTGENVANYYHFDVTRLDITFDMEPGYDTIYFNVVFGSEEFPDGEDPDWPQYVGDVFIDGFALYVNGSNIALAPAYGPPFDPLHPTRSVGIIPGSVAEGEPVETPPDNLRPININHPQMEDMDNYTTTELDGVLRTGDPYDSRSYVLTFAAQVDPQDNTLTLIVADTEDDILDTTVYISSLGAVPRDVDVKLIPDPDDGDSGIFENLSGTLSGLEVGEQATFDVRFEGDGAAHRFDLWMVVDDGTDSKILGKVPVTINNDYRYEVQAWDEDGDYPLTFELLQAPTGADWIPGTSTIGWEPPSDAGMHSFEVRVSDTRGGTDVQSWDVDVSTADQARSISFVTPQALPNATRYRAYSYKIVAQYDDPQADDNGSLQYHLIAILGQPLGDMRIDRDTGEILWRPHSMASRTFDVMVVDREGGKAERAFTIDVDPPSSSNTPPTLNVSGAPSAAVVGELYTFTAGASDNDYDPYWFDLPLKPEGMTIHEKLGEVRWVPSDEQIGVNKVVVRVRDGYGETTEILDITVSERNYAPAILVGPEGTATVDEEYVFQVIAGDPNSDDTIEFSLDATSLGKGMSINAATGLFRWTPIPDHVSGSPHDIQITVKDIPHQASYTKTYRLEVASGTANNLPEVHSSPRSSIQFGQDYKYQIVATDADHDELTYTPVTMPGGMQLNGSLIEWTPTDQDVAGSPHDVEVEISDGRGAPVSHSFDVSVTHEMINSPPEFTSDPIRYASVGNLYHYVIMASDEDGDLIHWSLKEAPAGMFLVPTDEGRAHLGWIPTGRDVGEHDVAILATDGFAAFIEQSFTVTVKGGNSAPWFVTTPPTLAKAGEPFAFVVRAEDPEGEEITYSYQGDPIAMTIDPKSGRLEWNSPEVGDYSITLIATDVHSRSGTQGPFTFSVTSQDLWPKIDSDPVEYAATNQLYEYSVDASSLNGYTLKYSVSVPSEIQGQINFSGTDLGGGWFSGELLSGTLTTAGEYRVVITVGEQQTALTRAQTYTLTVFDNTLPTIHFPNTLYRTFEVVEHQRFVLDVLALDPDVRDYEDEIYYSLEDALDPNMTIDSTGRITWPAAALPGGTVQVLVHDRYDPTNIVTADFDVQVIPDMPPTVELEGSPNPILPGYTLNIFVRASDDVGVVLRELQINGYLWQLYPSGRAWYPVPENQTQNLLIEAIAIDTAGQMSDIAQVIVEVIDPNLLPEAVITSPSAGAVLKYPVHVTGDVSDAEEWKLEIAALGQGTPKWTELASGTGDVSGNLTTEKLDPTALKNGPYMLRLTAKALTGYSEFEQPINIESELKLGNFKLSFTDLTIPVAGMPITIKRTYDTLRADDSGDFGYGWQLDMIKANVSADVAEPTEFSDYLVYAGFTDGTAVYIKLPDGRTERFTFMALGTGIPNVYVAYFMPDPGNTSVLELEPQRSLMKSGDEYVTFYSRIPFNPADEQLNLEYHVTTADGAEYLIDGPTGQLKVVRDRDGNRLEIEDTGLISREATGQIVAEVTIVRDGDRIRKIIDKSGNTIEYTYDGLGRLTKVEDRTGKVTEYVYGENGAPVNYLTSIKNGLDVTILKVSFEDGRANFITDASGEYVDFDYRLDLGENRFAEIVKDKAGAILHEVVRDEHGNVIRKIQPKPDSPDEYILTDFEYDQYGNLLRESLPFEVTEVTGDDRYDFALPRTWSRQIENTYDEGRLVAQIETDVFGRTSSYTYDGYGNLTRIVDQAGNETVYNYTNGKLKQVRDAEDNITVYEYNGTTGNLERLVQLDDDKRRVVLSEFEYERGYLTKVIDANGFERNFEYDSATGNQTKSWYLWNGSTKIITETKYDDEGRVEGTILWVGPEGSEVKQWETFVTYDAAGRVETSTNRYGIVTTNTYDARGSLIETYTQAEDEDGNDVYIVTRTVYDDYGRPIDQSDPHKEDVGADGKPVSIYSQGTRTEYDALGRVKRTERLQLLEIVLADDPVYSGQKISTLDDLFIGFPITSSETITTYDIAGRVESVDAPGVWLKVYEYDAAGQSKHTAWDADGDINTTGDRTTAAQYQYDAAGRQQYVTHDFDGDLHLETGGTTGDRYMTQYVYDGLGRVERTIYPDPDGDPGAELPQTETAVTYDSLGRRVAETDQMGQTTYYEYDDAGRLTAVILPAVPHPDTGQPAYPRYEYEYDAYGNQTKIRTNLYQESLEEGAVVHGSGAHDTTFTYDHLNRMLTRTLPLGQTETFDYYDDPAVDADHELGQLKYTIDFEGCVTAYEYDEFARVEYKHFFPSYSGTSGDSYQEWVADDAIDHEAVRYKYDAFGRRLEVIQDADGDLTTTTDDQYKTTYTYNDRGQVTQIEYIDTADTDGELFKGMVKYVYSEATGRLEETYAGENVPSATMIADYTYDDLGRLKKVWTMTVVFGDAELNEYTYDALGNLKTITLGNGNYSEYGYDGLSRLVNLAHYQSDGGTKLAEYSYTLRDDGRRVRANEFRYAAGVPDVTTQIDWVYDNLGRLIIEAYDSSDNALDYAAIYAFDLVGNRLIKLIGSQRLTEYSYDANDRLLTEKLDADGDGSFDETTAYGYGPNADPGNGVGGDSTTLTTKVVHSGEGTGGAKLSETTYQYNLQGRQSRVEVDSDGDGPDPADVEEYLYNDNGIRVAKIEDPDGAPTRTYFIVDPNNPTGYAQVVEEYGVETASQTRTMSYFVGLDMICQRDESGDKQYFLADGHGSTRLLTGDDGLAIANQHFDYDAYGNMLDDTVDPLTTHLYAGEQLDKATGAYYLRARYYDPASGRFSRPDPFAGINSDPISLHKYLYVGADPINGIDPSGLMQWNFATVTTAIGIGSLLSGITTTAVGHVTHDSLVRDLGTHMITAGLALIGAGGLGFMAIIPHAAAQGAVQAVVGFAVASVYSAVQYGVVPRAKKGQDVSLILNLLKVNQNSQPLRSPGIIVLTDESSYLFPEDYNLWNPLSNPRPMLWTNPGNVLISYQIDKHDNRFEVTVNRYLVDLNGLWGPSDYGEVSFTLWDTANVGIGSEPGLYPMHWYDYRR